MKRKFLFGLIFLFVQVLSIVYARFVPERFFCWAPYDQHTYYEINVKIGEVELSYDEIYRRYRYQPSGWEPRSIFNVINLVNQYESTYEKFNKASVSIKYSINGGSEEIYLVK